MQTESDSTSGAPGDPPTGGVFISRGMRLAIKNLRISLREDGSFESAADIHLSLDLCPYWLELAMSRAAEADAAHKELVASWAVAAPEQRAAHMEAEFSASMQSIMASAIALDAFYASTKEHVPLPSDLVDRWRENGTARYKQITEVLRRAYEVRPRGAVALRAALEEVQRFRDWAVHPPARARQPEWYEDIGVATEWRYVAFRSHNARALCAKALSIVGQLVVKPRANLRALVDYCASARPVLLPLVERFEGIHGSIRPSNEPS